MNKLTGRFSSDTRSNPMFHVLALIIVAIWGITFISTKILLKSGLSPSDILFYRFILAYIGICLCSRPFKLFAYSLKDEFLCFSIGLLGGTLYFITENTALKYTMVSNVALICSTTPLLTMLIQYLLIKQTLPSGKVLTGSILAFAGVGAVIFNGKFVLNLNPAGDLLCLASALSWTLYTLVSKYLTDKYPAMFIVRKTFFYGLLTLIPFLAIQGSLTTSPRILLQPEVWSQLLFLGIVDTIICIM